MLPTKESVNRLSIAGIARTEAMAARDIAAPEGKGDVLPQREVPSLLSAAAVWGEKCIDWIHATNDCCE